MYVKTTLLYKLNVAVSSEWVKSLTSAATSKFLRAAALGVELGEPWLVGNAAVYVWNYSNHLVKQHRQNEIVDCLLSLVDAFKVVGHTRYCH